MYNRRSNNTRPRRPSVQNHDQERLRALQEIDEISRQELADLENEYGVRPRKRSGFSTIVRVFLFVFGFILLLSVLGFFMRVIRRQMLLKKFQDRWFRLSYFHRKPTKSDNCHEDNKLRDMVDVAKPYFSFWYREGCDSCLRINDDGEAVGMRVDMIKFLNQDASKNFPLMIFDCSKTIVNGPVRPEYVPALYYHYGPITNKQHELYTGPSNYEDIRDWILQRFV